MVRRGAQAGGRLVGIDWPAITQGQAHASKQGLWTPHRTGCAGDWSRPWHRPSHRRGPPRARNRIVLGDIDDVSEASDLIGATGHPAVPVTPDVSDPSSIEAAHDRVTDPRGASPRSRGAGTGLCRGLAGPCLRETLAKARAISPEVCPPDFGFQAPGAGAVDGVVSAFVGSALSNPEDEVANTARQNVRFGAAHLTGSATSIGARNGGSARGYQELPAPLAILAIAEQAAARPVCLCIASPGVIARTCREEARQGPPGGGFEQCYDQCTPEVSPQPWRLPSVRGFRQACQRVPSCSRPASCSLVQYGAFRNGTSAPGLCNRESVSLCPVARQAFLSSTRPTRRAAPGPKGYSEEGIR